MSKLGIAAVVIGGLLAFGAITGGSGDGDSAGDSYGAEEACKSWVKDKLKAPATADFANINNSGDGPWSISGDVDAENGFGAKIRTSWFCDARLVGDTYRGSATLLQ